jgi:hypothetical protein
MEAIMAQSKKRVAALRKRKSTVRRRARKSSKSVRGKAAKRTATKLRSKKAVAKTKRPKAEKVARKKARPQKPPIIPVAETKIVDVVEKPARGVITITEFEETDIREAGAREEPPEES